MSTELEQIDQQHSMIMTPEQAKAELHRLQEFVRSVMIEGTDYGTIPGAGDKKNLLKPGAEKLCEIYAYAPHVDILDRVQDWTATPPFFAYTVKVILVNKRNGITVAEGVGSCNVMESKYRYRLEYWNGQGDPPQGDGYVRKQKRGGQGSYWQRRIVNEDTADLDNTILKMAKKRALIDATLSATRSSELFTQDLEDMGVVDAEFTAETTEQKPAPKRGAKAAQGLPCQGTDDEGNPCKNTITGYTAKKSGKTYTAEEVAEFSRRDFGKALCYHCSTKAKAEVAEEQSESDEDRTAEAGDTAFLTDAG
jgi:hypothetical protein